MGWLPRSPMVVRFFALGVLLACGEQAAKEDPHPTKTGVFTYREAPVANVSRALMLGNANVVVKPGERVPLAMRWEGAPLPADYQAFVHFVDASGVQASFAGDHAPPTPTSRWSGPVAYDHLTRAIPADATPGVYSIRVGLYELTPPYDQRVTLATGPGVIADEQQRYTVGTLTVSNDPSTPSTPPTPPGTVAGPAGQNAADYVLTFEEEFDAFDPNRWNDHIWYESSNPTINYAVENGVLKIWPQRDASGNFFNRTIDTDGKYYQTYGFFEAEMKLTKGKGTWPAFWLFNHIGDRRPEIDVMEAYPGGQGWGIDGPGGVRLPTAYGATIWLDANVRGGFEIIQTPDLSAATHKYGVKWEPNKQTFFFDGQPVYTADVSMSDPMYIMLDLWFGSASGTPDATTPTGKNNSFEVSYVRAWQFK